MGLSVAMLMASCAERPNFLSYAKVEESGWLRTDTAVVVRQADSDSLMRTFTPNVCLRYTNACNLTDMVLELQVRDCSTGKPAKRIMTDTLTYQINTAEGKTLGNGVYVQEKVLQSHHAVKLHSERIYEFRVTHLMKLDPLPHVVNVGILLEVGSKN